MRWIVMVLFCIGSSHALNWLWRELPCDIMLSNTSVSLDCSKRELNTIPKLCVYNATFVDLSSNYIKRVPKDSFSNLHNLTSLDLKRNQIHSGQDAADFSNLINLKTLLLDGNFIFNIPKVVPPGLQELSLSNNHISTIRASDFSGMKNLRKFTLNMNCYYDCNGTLNIQNGTFTDLHDLTYLSLSKNRLKKIPPYLPKSLQTLHLTQNTIERITEHDMMHLTNLKILDLSGNCPICYNAPFPCSPCKTINKSIQIDPEAFSQLSNLHELRLSGNSLQSLNSSWFKNLTSLKYLYVSFNYLINDIESGHFYSVLPHLEVIDLSYNNPAQKLSSRLTLSKEFSKMKSLKTLHMEGYMFSVLCESDLKPLFSLKHLSVINLGINFVHLTNLSIFRNFNNLSVISLIDNRLTFTGMKTNSHDSVCVGDADSYSDEHDTRGPFIHWDTDFRRYPPFIKPECLATGHVLDLSRNNIYYIVPDLLQATNNITCLNLSSNLIGSFFNGTEFIHFPKLKYLDLSHNRVYLRLNSAFSELKELEVLDLSYNKHYFEVAGVTHKLAFLAELKFIKVLNLSWNEINMLNDKTLNSSSLIELQFPGNRLDIMWKKDKGFNSLFKFLTNLTYLDISYNKLRQLPDNILSDFPPTLKYLSLSKNQLGYFDWEQLKYLPKLEVLDLSKNKLDFMAESLALHTRSLRILDLSHNMISQLEPNFLKAAKSLRILKLSFNQLQLINETTFPQHNENDLDTLYLDSNPFHCTCDLLDFVLWLEKSEVKIPRLATGLLCDLPASNKGQPMISLHLKDACINDTTAQTLYIIWSTLVIITTLTAIAIHLFYWDVSYIVTFCRAKMKSSGTQSKEDVYDAFILYDTKDAMATEWVLNLLRAELEDRGERVRPLCLEERDWTPGSSIMDNLNQSVRWSRRTVFVLTEGFVHSGIFRMAAYLAQQRLLEEGVDVMVLILLEPVLKRSRILNLRRCLCSDSVLEWPTNPAAESWFWQSLRNAIRHEKQDVKSKLFKNYFTS